MFLATLAETMCLRQTQSDVKKITDHSGTFQIITLKNSLKVKIRGKEVYMFEDEGLWFVEG